MRGLYDGAVAESTRGPGNPGRARALGQAKNTIVVILADHGETLYENGHGEGHGDHLFGDEGTHVPFLVHDRARRRRPGCTGTSPASCATSTSRRRSTT